MGAVPLISFRRLLGTLAKEDRSHCFGNSLATYHGAELNETVAHERPRGHNLERFDLNAFNRSLHPPPSDIEINH